MQKIKGFHTKLLKCSEKAAGHRPALRAGHGSSQFRFLSGSSHNGEHLKCQGFSVWLIECVLISGSQPVECDLFEIDGPFDQGCLSLLENTNIYDS